jgi:hypothetical protein
MSMYGDEDLVSAVGAGILTEENVSAFRSHVAQLRQAPAVSSSVFTL